MRKIMRTLLVLFVVMVLVVPIFAGAVRDSANKRSRIPSGSRIIYVKSGVTARNIFPTIQAGVDAASSGYTVFVYNGSYDENVDVGKSITIMGENEYSTFVNASNPSDHVFSITADRVAIIGFTIQGATTTNYGGVNIDDSQSVLVSENIISGNNDGIRIWGSITGGGHNTILNNNISGNKNTASGIYIVQSEYNTISDNLIRDNGNGIWVYLNSTNNEFYNNEISDNDKTGLSVSGASVNNLIFHNNIIDNTFQASDASAVNNNWHNTTILEGNYWSDYSGLDDGSGTGKHATSGDGIGDTSIPHPATNFDFYPLMSPFAEEDTEAPEIVGEIVTRSINETATKIVWNTDEQSDSMVQFSSKSNIFSESIIDPLLTTTHSLTLDNLLPSTTYNYFVSSKDSTGNEMSSKVQYFRTSAKVDDEDPSVELNVPNNVSGIITVEAIAKDNIGIDRVEFYLDEEHLLTDFTGELQERSNNSTRASSSQDMRRAYSYKIPFDTTLKDNGQYSLKAKALDFRGKFKITIVEINIINLVLDATPPSVQITNPSYNAAVNGEVNFYVTAIDDESALDRIEFYVAGELKATEPLSTPNGLQAIALYVWDTNNVANGHVSIYAKAYNQYELGNTTYSFVFVNNPVYLNPNLELSRVEVKHLRNAWYWVKLKLENIGSVTAYDIVVTDSHIGFQAHEDPYCSFGTEVIYFDSLKNCQINFTVSSLQSGHSVDLTFYLVPILLAPDPYKMLYSIGISSVVDFQDYNENEYQDIYSIPAVSFKENDISITQLNTNNILDGVGGCDYLIVTHPNKLFNVFNDDQGVNELLTWIARFASEKNGVLGYLDEPDINDVRLELENAINSIFIEKPSITNPSTMEIICGGWNHVLSDDWSSNGFMLLLGEIEIIPAEDIDVTAMNYASDFPNIIEHSDHRYTDVTGDNVPDIVVGRIIGNQNPGEMMNTIQNSLGVEESWPGYGFDKSDILLVSGTGLDHDSFIYAIKDDEEIVDPKFDNVDVLHYADYVPLDDFSIPDYSGVDSITTGNMGGDSEDEIIILDNSENKIHIYNPDGNHLTDFSITSTLIPKVYSGDVSGDSKDEIIVFDYSFGHVYIYKCYYLGNSQWDIGLLNDFGSSILGAKIAIGNVMSNNKDEIMIFDTKITLPLDNSSTLKVYNENGLEMRDIDFTIAYMDLVAAGDFIEGGFDEIVVVDNSNNFINIYDGWGIEILDSSGNTYSFPRELEGLYRLMVGDPIAGGPEEIVVISLDKHWIYTWNVQTWGGSIQQFRLYTENDGFAVGNTLGDSKDEIFIADASEDLVIYTDVEYVNRIRPQITSRIMNKDVIYWFGHGGPNVWDPSLSTIDIPNDLGNVNPFILSTSCSTGDYRAGDLVDRFFDAGAVVFYGSTEVSKNMMNSAFGATFFNSWDSNEPVGRTITDFEKGVNQNNHWKYFCYQYNIYGDPKFGELQFSTTRGGENTINNTRGCTRALRNIPSILQLELPDFVNKTFYGYDFIDIPDGQIILEPNEYRVPFFMKSIEYPEGYLIQDVILTGRSGLETSSGFKLILNTDEIASSKPRENITSNLSTSDEDWYPNKEFDWDVIHNANGTSTLQIMVYPMYYNSETTEIKYYKNFEFDIDYVQSNIEILNANSDKLEYAQGETVEIEVLIENTGDNVSNIVLSSQLESYYCDYFIDGLTLQSYAVPVGKSLATLFLNTTGYSTGVSVVKVEAHDMNGTLLDVKWIRFEIGQSKGEISDFSVSQQLFNIGDSLSIELKFKNTGTVSYNGTAELKITTSTGSIIKEFYHEFSLLEPGNFAIIKSIWDTTGISKGNYYIRGSVHFDGKSIVTETIEVKDFSTSIDELKDLVDGTDAPRFKKRILNWKLKLAQKFIEKAQKFEMKGKDRCTRVMTKVAIIMLKCFQKKVAKYECKYLTETEAEVLIAKAQLIIDNLDV